VELGKNQVKQLLFYSLSNLPPFGYISSTMYSIVHLPEKGSISRYIRDRYRMSAEIAGASVFMADFKHFLALLVYVVVSAIGDTIEPLIE